MVLAAAVVVLAAGMTQAAVNIVLVPVGNAGNAPDTEVMGDGTSGYGSVGYNYQIGKYEVTAGQYTEFLNFKAKTDNGYGLYNTEMSSSVEGCKIQRSVTSDGFFTYSVDRDAANRPVSSVSFWDAARFTNWLHNGQGTGDTESGAYINIGNQSTFARQPGAKYWIPSENEWYKAAYHDPRNGVPTGYFDYPTGTDLVPGWDMSEATNVGNNANYYGPSAPLPIDSPYYTTVVGEFEWSDSPYGTFDQGGNVYEWNDTAVNLSRGLRGGLYGYNSDHMFAAARNYIDPMNEGTGVGFRVAGVPEPGSVAMLAGIAAMMLLHWWRRRNA